MANAIKRVFTQMTALDLDYFCETRDFFAEVEYTRSTSSLCLSIERRATSVERRVSNLTLVDENEKLVRGNMFCFIFDQCPRVPTSSADECFELTS
jgi:hypothetical protein